MASDDVDDDDDGDGDQYEDEDGDDQEHHLFFHFFDNKVLPLGNAYGSPQLLVPGLALKPLKSERLCNSFLPPFWDTFHQLVGTLESRVHVI